MPTATKTATNGSTPAASATAQLQIERVGRDHLLVPIVGTAPLIVSKFSEKAKRTMLDAMQGKRSPKEKKNPEAEYEAAFYRFGDGYGLPAIAFKACTVGAARYFGTKVTMTGLRATLFFKGEIPEGEAQPLVEIIGEPYMREDVVRNSGGSTDLRYRPSFPEWKATLEVLYVRSMLTKESVLSLIDAGGMGIGVGEWRPERNGDFGTFQIDDTRDVVALPS